jgi:hypothetical protein
MPHDRIVLPPGIVVCGQHIAAGTDIGVYGPRLVFTERTPSAKVLTYSGQRDGLERKRKLGG